MEKEIWKDIPGYEGLYQVSSLGNVKSLNYNRTGKQQILKLFTDKDGYKEVCLCKNTKKKSYKIHYLVLNSFVGDRPIIDSEILQINHINGIKIDNRLKNLEFCTASENQKHKYRVLGYKAYNPTLGKFGKQHHRSIPVNRYDLQGNFIDTFESINLAYTITGIPSGLISRCINKKQRKTNGYIWMRI